MEDNTVQRRRSAPRKERLLQVAALLLLTAVAGIGCSPLGTLSFLLSNNEALEQPEISLAIEDKESTVAIIGMHAELMPDSTFVKAHEEVVRRLAQQLERCYKENEDKIKVVPVTKVFSYVNNHPEWLTQSKQELGKRFNADYIVLVEFDKMSMWEPGSRETLYRGNAEINLKLFDVHARDGESMKREKCFNIKFPTDLPKDAGDMTRPEFRMKFLDRISQELTECFAAHPKKQRIDGN